MTHRQSTPEATDQLFDTSPSTMAAMFGRRTLEFIRTGREGEVRESARLAFSYAFLAAPALRAEVMEQSSHSTAEAAIVHGDWPFVCLYCSQEFQTNDGNYPYCSTFCAVQAQVDR